MASERAIVQASAIITEDALHRDGRAAVEYIKSALARQLAYHILNMDGVFRVDYPDEGYPITVSAQVELMTPALLREIARQAIDVLRRGRIPSYNRITGAVEPL